MVWNILRNLFSWVWINKQWALTIILALLCIFFIWSGKNKDEKINHLLHDTQALNDAKKSLEEEMNGLSLKLSFKNHTYDVLVRGKNGDIAHRSGYIPDEGSITFKEFKLTQSRFITNSDGILSPISNTSATSVTSTVETKVVTKIVDHLTDGWFDRMKRWLHETFIGPVIEGDNSQIDIKDRGLTFKPGLGIMYDKNQRYGLNLGLDAKLFYYKRLSMGLGATPDFSYIWGSTHIDKISFGYINNFEFMIGYGTPYEEFLNQGKFIIGLRSNL